MQIDPNKLYTVKMVFVKPYFRRNFQRPSLLFKVEIPEVLATTTRTLNIPKTLDPSLAIAKCKFKQVIGPILKQHYSDSLLKDLNKLAKALDHELTGKTFLAYLSESKTGDYINLVSLQHEARQAS